MAGTWLYADHSKLKSDVLDDRAESSLAENSSIDERAEDEVDA